MVKRFSFMHYTIIRHRKFGTVGISRVDWFDVFLADAANAALGVAFATGRPPLRSRITVLGSNAPFAGFGRKPVAIGCGGTIGFVGPLSELLGGAPALLIGIEDPQSNAHAPNESLHEGDFRKLMAALAHLFDQLGRLPGGKVK